MIEIRDTAAGGDVLATTPHIEIAQAALDAAATMILQTRDQAQLVAVDSDNGEEIAFAVGGTNQLRPEVIGSDPEA